MFAEDAILIEPRMGHLCGLVASFWDYVCRVMLGQDALNWDRLEEEGTSEKTIFRPESTPT